MVFIIDTNGARPERSSWHDNNPLSDAREGRDRGDSFSSSHPFNPSRDDVPDDVTVCRLAQRIDSAHGVQVTGRNVRILCGLTFWQAQLAARATV